MKRAGAVILGVTVLSVAQPAQAQTPLSELLVRLLLSDIVLAPPTGAGVMSHEAHFRPIVNGELESGFDINQFEIPLAMNAMIVSQLSTIPLGSSSGGFSYVFDPTLGTFSRQGATFGSAFAERALTVGRGRWNAGFNFQRVPYDTLEGQSLRNGGIRVYLVHQDCCGTANTPDRPPSPFFEGDLIENTLRLKLTSSVFSTFLTYGVTDRIDVAVTVPVVTVLMDAQVDARIVRLATAGLPNIHSFDGMGSSTKSFSDSGRAQGLGDVLARSKFRFFDAARGGLAAGVDVRLPTGDSRQLLGIGHLQSRVTLIGSLAEGPFSPHVNVGYLFSTGGDVGPLSMLPQFPNEFGYVAGFDYAPSDRVTVSADIIGRTQRNVGRLVLVNQQFSFTDSDGRFGTATFEEFARHTGDLPLTVAALGVRFNPRGNLLISAQVLVPLTANGLRDRVTPVFGMDYSF